MYSVVIYVTFEYTLVYLKIINQNGIKFIDVVIAKALLKN